MHDQDNEIIRGGQGRMPAELEGAALGLSFCLGLGLILLAVAVCLMLSGCAYERSLHDVFPN